MDFDITKVTIDGSVDDLSDEQLRELVGKFQDAHESNVAEFERASEALDGVDEDNIEDFETAREGLFEEITEAEAFDEVPLSEEALEDSSFSELQEWRDFVLDQESSEDSSDTENGEGEEFDDFGSKSPTNPEDDEVEEFVEDTIGTMQGVNL